MKYWLAKSEEEAYTIDDFARDKRTFWDGVRNYAARNHMKAMKKGDLVFFYRSNGNPSAIVGVAEVLGEARVDETQFSKGDEMNYDPKARREKPIWFGVDLGYVAHLPRPVTLEDVKGEKKLAKMALIRISRLSVQPVTEAEWKVVMSLARSAGDAPRGPAKAAPNGGATRRAEARRVGPRSSRRAKPRR